MDITLKNTLAKPITDCAYLIDLPASNVIFNHQVKGNTITNPKACIRILTVLQPKNGLKHLL